ncbi:VCBS domain-containing protein, partial [Pseudorhodobacter sp. E13]|uniref:VCBS domain-containing protein n=1 Tax=Pseudorhodobacter sp. E13 TaxID=2487931 RepID=UPI0018F453FA
MGYGTYSVDAGGAWSYLIDDANPAVNGLNLGETLTDSFTITTEDGTTETVTVTIEGAN